MYHVFWMLLLASTVFAFPNFETHRSGLDNLRNRATDLQFAVLGESFASGVSWLINKQYDVPDPQPCRRYKNAYGPQIVKDGRLGNANLTFLACSGQKVPSINGTQVPNIPEDASFATISAGGNDALFFPTINACVLRSDEGLTDQNCQDSQRDTNNTIDKDVPGYTTMYKYALDQVSNPDFKLYVMGYPRFFNADTDQCDNATFAFKQDEAGGPYLTKDIRKSINDLIQKMNDALNATVNSMDDDRVYFVDISPFFEGHRFCEEGIQEPYSGGRFKIDDNAAWLYHFDWNPLHELNGGSGDPTDYPPATWSCDEDLLNDDDMGAILQCGLADSGITSLPFAGPLVEDDDSAVNDNITTNQLPDPGQYGLFQRTFHPTYRGHMAIKDAIFSAIDANAATTSVVPFTPTPTPTPTGNPTCVGNQVESSCVAATLPSTTPFSGPQGPSCAKADGSPGSSPRLNATVAQNAAAQYCQSLIDNKVVLSGGSENPAPYVDKGTAENGADMALTVMFYESACPLDQSSSELDFTAMGLDACSADFSTNIEVMCSMDDTWNAYDPQWTFQGGVLGDSCGLFSITGS